MKYTPTSSQKQEMLNGNYIVFYYFSLINNINSNESYVYDAKVKYDSVDKDYTIYFYDNGLIMSTYTKLCIQSKAGVEECFDNFIETHGGKYVRAV